VVVGPVAGQLGPNAGSGQGERRESLVGPVGPKTDGERVFVLPFSFLLFSFVSFYFKSHLKTH